MKFLLERDAEQFVFQTTKQ